MKRLTYKDMLEEAWKIWLCRHENSIHAGRTANLETLEHVVTHLHALIYKNTKPGRPPKFKYRDLEVSQLMAIDAIAIVEEGTTVEWIRSSISTHATRTNKQFNTWVDTSGALNIQRTR